MTNADEFTGRSTPVRPAVSRRTLLTGTGAVVAGGALATTALLRDDAAAQEGEVQVPATPVALGPVMPPEYTDYANDWPTQNGNLANTRTSASTTIDSRTVSTLGVAWTVPLSVEGPYGAVTAAPVINGDTVYLVDMLSNLYAIDKTTGETLWTKEYNVPTIGPNGVTVAYGYLFSILGDTAEVVAVDVETQEEVWRTKLSANTGEGIDIAPIVYDNTVYVSTVPGNSTVFYRGGQKGIFYALDASSGHTIWQWETTTDDLWGNGRVNSGGGLWNPPAVGEDGTLYLAVANGAPWPGNSEFPNGSSRPGDNDYANNIVSLDPTTASVNWHVNVKRHDIFDLDDHLSPVLTTVDIGGVPVEIVVTSGKHGYVMGVAVTSGVPLWKVAVGRHMNDELQEIPEGETVEVFPGSLGGVETCMAIANGVVFAPILNRSVTYSSIASESSQSLNEASGELVAIDAASGQILWQIDIPTAVFGAATVANDIVFTGGLDGVVRGYSVADGSSVWTSQAPTGLNAPFAISEDYLIVPAGGALIPGTDTVMPDAPGTALIAYKLGAGGGTDATAAPEGADAPPASPTTAP